MDFYGVYGFDGLLVMVREEVEHYRAPDGSGGWERDWWWELAVVLGMGVPFLID